MLCPGAPPLHPSFKTSDFHCNHWWKEHSNHRHWVWARQGEKLGVTMVEVVIVIIGKDLKVAPIPSDQPFSLLPKCFPSHPKGHSKLIFRELFCCKLAQPMHPSEQGLPWKAQHPAPQPPAINTKTDWGWPTFLNTFSESHQDITSMMSIHIPI